MAKAQLISVEHGGRIEFKNSKGPGPKLALIGMELLPKDQWTRTRGKNGQGGKMICVGKGTLMAVGERKDAPGRALKMSTAIYADPIDDAELKTYPVPVGKPTEAAPTVQADADGVIEM